MSMAIVDVRNISSQTSEKEVRDFFSFCGKISSLSLQNEHNGKQSAVVTFEKSTAAKTALLLDNTQLKESLVHVSSAVTHDETSSEKSASSTSESAVSSEHIAQEDKPRSRIIAEYLAHGYVLSDQAVERAIALDNQHGISSRFTNALQQFDQKYSVTPKAQDIDRKYAISEKAQTGWHSLSSYFEQTMDTPTGQRVMSFYQSGQKQVMDVHAEARRLADMKTKNKSTPEHIPGTNKTHCTCKGDLGKCGCIPGNCACTCCEKNADVTSSVDPEKADLHQVSDNPVRTQCNCKGDTGNCPCEAGKCACGSCSKNPEVNT